MPVVAVEVDCRKGDDSVILCPLLFVKIGHHQCRDQSSLHLSRLSLALNDPLHYSALHLGVEMGVNLPKGITLAGFRLTQVKQALKVYAQTDQEENFFEVESFASSRLEAAALYEELLERKLIDPKAISHEQHLTEDGLAIAGGKARRSPLRTAHRILDDLLARIEHMNEEAAPLNLVERVWLFGSVMCGQETVGDIDLAIETVHNPAFGDDASRSTRLRELVNQASDHLLYF
ncbi:hypothetical protein [Pseudochelatococcus lubricantis]|uniref:hypothetical protein n=1 Tax=Pseudochelatococcus lubricantis TaxID=1538102 RepID=UPI003671C2BA